MKFGARIFFLLVILGSFAVAAHAQTGVDPIIYTKAGGCCSIDLTTNSYTVTDYTTNPFPLSFLNDTGAAMDSFTLIFDHVPDGTAFECLTNIWANCTNSSVADPGNPGFENWTFTMNDSFGGNAVTPPTCEANDGGGNVCPGDLAAGAEMTTTSSTENNLTPEPESIYLFGTGLIGCFWLPRKLRFRPRERKLA